MTVPKPLKIGVSLLLLCWNALLLPVSGQAPPGANQRVQLLIHRVDKDTASVPYAPYITRFNTYKEAYDYVQAIPATLVRKGYPLASVDSLAAQDTLLEAWLYTGQLFRWMQLASTGIDPKALQAAGFRESQFRNQLFETERLNQLMERLLQYYENNGYPFARVYLDSVHINGDSVNALLKADPSVAYRIDSIRLLGGAKLKSAFLQRYLLMPNGSLYSKEKLTQVDKRIRELTFLSLIQPADLSMLGSGATLNVYAKPRKSSRADFLLGFLPNANNSGKMQVTADVNLDLKNMFRNGESILFKWQQLQPKSPRLNLGYVQPYVLGSPFGVDLAFDLFKKDSSFLLLQAQVGIPYAVSAQQTAKLFFQWQLTSLLPGAVDTIAIRNQKKLPVNIDASVANIGLQFDWNRTDYRLNPRKGYEWRWTGTIGIKNIRKNNDILSINDPAYDYNKLYDSIRLRNYQLRLKAAGAHYLPVGKRATIKLGLQAGYYGSPEIFRNDLFQIGGYQLLRGFDEESIYATRYAVLTAEWRLLIDQNSYVLFFSDGGLSVNRFQDVNIQNQYISGGLGILYETKAGLLNLSFAIGKRNDVPFNLRSASKLHFGYINYF